ncbi:hypothetical protein AAG570_012585 [Ranatra chinensis]|uniref:Reverse transcriptase domain-containing protein n=1 Tax=Ranatra chinensis TaxID=642074 RepID=A0ABD0YEC5_9HEMI
MASERRNMFNKNNELGMIERDIITIVRKFTVRMQKPNTLDDAVIVIVEEEANFKSCWPTMNMGVASAGDGKWAVSTNNSRGQEGRHQGAPRYRVVVDYRVLNKRTKPEKYPLPWLEEMIDHMRGVRVFSVLDLKSGYHQIRKNPDNVEKIAFQFGRGNYEFVRMSFGLRNAPITFQLLMDEFLRGLGEDFVQTFLAISSYLVWDPQNIRSIWNQLDKG